MMITVATFEEWLNEQRIFESTKVDDLIAKAKFKKEIFGETLY
jgi:hypothetical protein